MEKQNNPKDLLGQSRATPLNSSTPSPHFPIPGPRSAEDPRLEQLRFAALLATVSEGVLISKPCGTVTMCNDRAAQILRLSQEQICNGEHYELCHCALQQDGTPFDLTQHPVLLAFQSGHAQKGVVMGLRHPDGDVGWISVNTMPLFADGGTLPIEVMCTITDITAKVQHETRIQTQQRWLEEAQRIARLGSWTWAPAMNRVWWSDAIYELFGVERTTEPSYENFLSLVHPEDRLHAQERVKAMLAGDDEFASDLRLIRPDQSCIWIHSRARAHRDEWGNIILVEGTDQDITDRKQSEVALRSSEQRLGIALKAAGAVAFEWDIPNDLIVRHFFNTDNWPLPLDAPYSIDTLRKRIHPEDLASFDARLCF